MKTTRKILLIFLSFSIILPCCSSEDCPSSFQLNAEIVNVKEEYKVGDTIKILSHFPVVVSATTPLPVMDAGEYNMEGINWQPATLIHKIDSSAIGLESQTVNYVDFIENQNYKYDTSIFSSGNSRLDGVYNESNGFFDLEIVLIAKLPGTYFLCQGSDLQNSFQDFEGRCKGLGIYAEVIMNNRDDNNINLLKESPNPHWDRIFEKPEERFYKKGGYCFKIVE